MDNIGVHWLDVYKNCIIKRYASGRVEILAADAAVFRPPGWESNSKSKEIVRGVGGASSREDIERSRRRARAMIAEYGFANDFTHFVTLTLNAEKIERYDISVIMGQIRAWLSNKVQREGLKYVLVPERHKKGGIHFHGLVNDALHLVDSGTVKLDGERPHKPRSKAERARLMEQGAHLVYNVADWDYGFSTALELYGDYAAAVGYVCKYIGKDSQKIGGRWYYSGGGLRRADRAFRNVDYADFQGLADEFEIRRLGCHCVKLVGDEKILDIVGEK